MNAKELMEQRGLETLVGADLTRADLTCAQLRGADLTHADLTGADLRGADLTRATLWGADLTRADLRGADLTHADLWGADLTGADLRGAKNIWLYGPVGSRGDMLYVVCWEDGLRYKTGCFWGTRAEFETRIAETHGDNCYAQQYRALIECAERVAELAK